jgi:hypothetical protein
MVSSAIKVSSCEDGFAHKGKTIQRGFDNIETGHSGSVRSESRRRYWNSMLEL